MQIGGFQKLTLIDYPGKLATTVFTVGCNFRCPFCHNPELILGDKQQISDGANNGEKEFFKFLEKRRGILEGVCITGGEPTIQPDLIEFIGKIREMGYSVKLDTNGTRPDVVKKLLELNFIDFVAMDIKNQLKKYDETTEIKGDAERVDLTVKMIMSSKLPYEFRTTVVPGIHQYEDFDEIAKWINGADNYWLQKYRETKILNPNLKKKTKGKSIDLEKIKKRVEKNFGKMGIRE